MPAKAIDCAAFLVSHAIESDKRITNLQLQKMLFLAQVDYMTSHNGRKLFGDDIYVWQYGPVIPLVYNAYSHYGGSPIREVSTPLGHVVVGSDVRLDDPEMERAMTRVYEKWVDKPAWSLVAESHKPGMAWDRVYNRGGKSGSGYGQIIDDATIMDAYGRPAAWT